MITIQRNGKKMEVSKGAFNLYYKEIGFKIVGAKEKEPNENPKKAGDK